MKTKSFLNQLAGPLLIGYATAAVVCLALIAGTPWLFLAWWLVCGFWCHATLFGHFQHRFPLIAREKYRSDFMMTAIISLFGPIALGAFWDFRRLEKEPKQPLKWF